MVWCDGATNRAGLQTRFGLDREGESLFLYDAQTERVGGMRYGLQLADYTVGRVGGEWELTEPTPGGVNEVANVGGVTNLVINEFMADAPAGGEDWVELHNQSTNLPVGLRGLYLATSNALSQIKDLSFVGPGGFVQLLADEKPGAGHLDMKLSAGGGGLMLLDETGLELNRVSYGLQREGVSQGRWPDGVGSWVSFAGRASQGEQLCGRVSGADVERVDGAQ